MVKWASQTNKKAPPRGRVKERSGLEIRFGAA